MTPEEKLDRLTERTDALAQSVELLASMHRDNETRMDAVMAEIRTHIGRMTDAMTQITDAMTHMIDTITHTTDTMTRMTRSMANMADSIGRLANIAGALDQRISDLEGGKQ
jgi:methyl-accepting chemotaxis protein